MEPEITISGIRYAVISEKPFEFEGKQRMSLIIRRLKGKRHYFVIRYENGALSNPVAVT